MEVRSKLWIGRVRTQLWVYERWGVGKPHEFESLRRDKYRGKGDRWRVDTRSSNGSKHLNLIGPRHVIVLEEEVELILGHRIVRSHSS
jgi:hypothetical protein